MTDLFLGRPSPQATVGRILAQPNPLPADPNSPGAISWESNAKKAELYLSRDGGPEKRVSGRSSGDFDSKRIRAGVDHLFRLYSLKPTAGLLAELHVTREVVGRISANPNPVPLAAMGKTTLTWEAPESVGAEICVSTDGGEEQLVCQAGSGSWTGDWFSPGQEYAFRLYTQKSPRRLLDEVTVCVSEPPPQESFRVLEGDRLVEAIAAGLRKLGDDERWPAWFKLWEKSGFHVTPVHFYQPIPDSRELNEKLWDQVQELPGIEMNDAAQFALLSEAFPRFKVEYEQIPTHPTPGRSHFYLRNTRFESLDPLLAYCMVRHFHPRKIIEVGAGFSTLLLAQAARKNGKTELHCIEPYPEDFLRQEIAGLTSLRAQKVQDVELSGLLELEAGDFLFIDTSHVVKIGGDVNFLLLEVIPRLKPGVLVHLHDIFLPFEYPKAWVLDEHRFWTEQYLLQAFLTFNSEFEVLVSAAHLHARHLEDLKTMFPRCEPWVGGSFWMRRKPARRTQDPKDIRVAAAGYHLPANPLGLAGLDKPGTPGQSPGE